MQVPVILPDKDLSVRFVVVSLAGLALASFAVRLWLLQQSIAAETFFPLDPDGYMRNGRLLAQDGHGWRWTLDAIRYPWDGRTYLLPPLYPVFLSLFVLVSDSPQTSALVAQMALNALSSVALFVIGTHLHSRRAGLIAAVVYAFWIPSIWAWPLFWQEQLYLPLLLAAFALLLRATATNASTAAFVCAGAAFGLAALTRSMPMYYVILAAPGYVLMTRNDPLALRRAAGLVVGFLAVTGPYSLWLSQQVGQFVFIENHGGISVHMFGGARAAGVPRFGQIVGQLFEAFWREPVRFLWTWSGYALALFNVHGDRWLRSVDASSIEGATLAKVIAHLGIDLPFIATVVLAPLGAVLARRGREAALLVSWVVLVVALSTLSAFGGIRYRSPFEPYLVALASVVVARTWRRPGRTALCVSALIAVAAAAMLAVQLPRVVRGRANYGVKGWTDTERGRRTWADGSLGLNVFPRDGALTFRLYPLEPVSEQPTRISVRINGHNVADRLLSVAEPVELRFVQRHGGFHYVEIGATAAGQPARVGIELPR